jgi:hypothetical protein
MEVVGNVPISPVIEVESTAPATVIPEPARTAKPEAAPRSTVIGVARMLWLIKKADVTTSPMEIRFVLFCNFIIKSFVIIIVLLSLAYASSVSF